MYSLTNYRDRIIYVANYKFFPALNCLQIVLVDCIDMRLSFDITLLKILQTTDQLATVCPTRVLQLWALATLGSHINGDAQR